MLGYVVGYALVMLIGFSSGLVIASAVCAFITAIGMVPRLAQKTGTENNAKIYESAIAIGGLLGAVSGIVNPYLPIGSLAVTAIGFAVGIFHGVLAMSLAEVLNVIPILTRRARLQQGMFFFILAIAMGKLCGSLLYALVPGFHSPGG